MPVPVAVMNSVMSFRVHTSWAVKLAWWMQGLAGRL
jgi:hypothetical protein